MATATYYSPFYPSPLTDGSKGSTIAPVTSERVDGVVASVGAVDTKANQNATDILTQTGRVSAALLAFSTLQTDVNYQLQLTKNDLAVATNQLHTEITNTKYDLQQADTLIQTSVSGLRTDTNALRVDVNQAKSDITTNKQQAATDVANVRSDLSVTNSNLATTKSDLTNEVTRAKADTASIRTDLGTTNSTAAGIRTDLTSEVTRAKADTASIRTVTTQLQIDVTGNTTAITNEATTRANADSALSNRSTTLESQFAGTTGSYINSRIATEETTRASADSAVNSRVDSLTTTVNGNTSRIATEETTRSNADSALAGRATTLESQFAGTTSSAVLSRIVTEESTRSNADSALAGRATTLESQFAGTAGSQIQSRIATEESTRSTADVALGNRATTLESQFAGTTGSYINSRIATEETTRSNADSALSGRATTLESQFAGNTGSYINSRIATEETTRANADSAVNSRVDSLTTTVNTNTANITTEATTRASADSALANRATTLESKVGNNGVINVNPTFANYTSATGTADGWTTDNQVGNGASRVAGETGGFALQLNADPNANAYAAQTLGPVAANTWWVIEADVKLLSGTFAGAGVLFRVGSQDATINFVSDKDSTDAVVGAGTVGQTYRFRKLVQITQSSSAPTLYYMNHWGALGSISAANSIVWYRDAVRPASSAEIAAQRADTNASSALARITTEETTRANADSALAGRATTLESQFAGTSGSAVLTRISTEETTRATADTALGNRATTLESQFTGNTGSYINSRIASEETTRASADSALSGRVDTLSSNYQNADNALSGRITTEETTRASADTALSGRTTTLESVRKNAVLTAFPQNMLDPGLWTFSEGDLSPTGFAYNDYHFGLNGENMFVFQTNSGESVALSTTATFKPVAGKTYRVTWKVRRWTSPSSGTSLVHPGFFIRYANNTSDYRNDTYQWSALSGDYINYDALAFEWTAPANVAWVRPRIHLNNGGSDARYMIAGVTIEDVTVANATTARITTEETTRANADSALASRATTLESKFDLGIDSNLYARVRTEETTRANADSALSTRATTLESNYAAQRVTYLPPNFNGETTDWGRDGSGAWYFEDHSNASGWDKHQGLLMVWNGDVDQFIYPKANGQNQLIPVQAGQTYRLRASVAMWGGTGSNIFVYFDKHAADGGYKGNTDNVAITPVGSLNHATFGADGSWHEVVTQVVVPQDAFFLRPILHVYGGGGFVRYITVEKADSVAKTDASVTSEATTRANADSALSSRVDSVVSNYQGADNTLQANINSEASTRASADSAIATRTDVLETGMQGVRDATRPADLSPQGRLGYRLDGAGSYSYSYEGNHGSVGYAIHIQGNPNYLYFHPSWRISKRVGRTYRVTVWFWRANRFSRPRIYWEDTDANGNNGRYRGEFASAIGTQAVDSNNTSAVQVWTKLTSDVTIDDGWQTSIQPVFNADPQGASDIGEFYISGMSLEDITESTASNARISTEETTRANADSALASRATTLESQFSLGTDSNLYARIRTEETTRSNADNALATRATTLESRTRGGGNLLTNTTFPNGDYSGWSPYNIPNDYGVNFAGDTWHPIGENVLGFRRSGEVGNVGFWSGGGWNAPAVPVIGGNWYQFYVYIAAHRAKVEVTCQWYDKNGNGLGNGFFTGGVTVPEGGQEPANWSRVGSQSVQAPSNAATVVFQISKWGTNTGQGDSYMWIWRPYVGEARAGLLDWNPYTAGTGQAVAAGTLARISTEESTRSSADSALSSRTGTLESQMSNTAGSGLQSRIITEENTRASADSAVASRTTTLESTHNYTGSASINVNPNFSAWPDGQDLPTGWQRWVYDGTTSRQNAPAFRGGYECRMDSNDGSNHGILVGGTELPDGWYVIELEAYLLSGTWNGAGITVSGIWSLSCATTSDTNEVVSANQAGNRKWAMLFKKTSNGTSFSFHLMNGWTGFVGYTQSKAVHWKRAAIRQASTAEINGQKALDTTSTLTARISTEESTRASADSALANRTSVVEAGVSNFMNNNALFNVAGYVSGNPYGWNGWDGTQNLSASSRPARSGTIPVRMQRDGNQQVGIRAGGLSNCPAGWYVIECEVEMFNGNWQGSGMHVNFNNGYAYNISFGGNADINNFTFGGNAYNRRSWSVLVYSGSQSEASFYAMGGWSGFGYDGSSNETHWHRCGFRPATDGEIKAQRVIDSNLIARVTTTESAVSNLNGRTSAYWQTTAVAGNNRAQLAIRADANGGAGVDIVGDVTISGGAVIDGTLNASKIIASTITTDRLVDNSVTKSVVMGTTNQYTGSGYTQIYGGSGTTGGGGGGSGGGSSGGSGDNCVIVTSYLPSGSQAGSAEAGDPLILLNRDNDDGYYVGKVQAIRYGAEQCFMLTTQSGIKLEVSHSTPITSRNGVAHAVIDSLGVLVPVLDEGDFRWEKITSVVPTGLKPVAMISADDGVYAAGETPGRYIFTHNIYYKP